MGPLLGVTELALLLGVSRSRASALGQRPDFPPPVADLASGPVWGLDAVNEFITGWERKPGRPRVEPTP